MNTPRTACAVAAAIACAVIAPPHTRAAITLDSIRFWTGSPAAPGLHQAALVIDFHFPGAPSGAPSLVWGYRWPAAESRTGQDMLAAVVAADLRLDASGLEFGFIDTISYDIDLDGIADFTHPGFDAGTGRYSAYWVNNAVVEGTPPLFADASHVLPPNGNPFASEAPGTWVFSSTGMAGRPLADGSWDGWVYASDALAGPREPVAAMVPEPSAPILMLAGSCYWLARRRRVAGAPSPPAARLLPSRLTSLA